MNDQAIIGSLVNALGGTCLQCGCNGDSCRLEAGEKCCWIDPFRSLCSNPKCVIAAGNTRRRLRRERGQAVQKKRQGRVA